MKQETFTLRNRSLLSKLLLTFALIVGANSAAWADTTIVTGSTIEEGWTTGNTASTSNKIDVPGSSAISSTSAFTSNTADKQLDPSYNSLWYALYSSNAVTITTGQKIAINAKGLTNYSAQLFVRYCTSKTPNSSYTVAANYTTVLQTSAPQSNFTELVVDNIPAGSYYIQIIAKAVSINSVVLQSASTPVLGVSPAGNAEFGSLAANDTKTYTVSNTGSGSLDVTIANTNPTDFTISKTSMSGIAGGESETFTITFNYNNEDLGEKTATITITPSVGDPYVITATATAISDNDPQLSVTPDDDTDLGALYSGSTTYTVTNTGTGLMTVNISSDNSDFVVSPTTIENLGYNESETFTVTYTFDPTAEKLGVNSANITVTPTYVGSVAKTYEVSATSNATFTLDEDTPSTPGYGEKNYLLVKYKPNSGWNTLSMPFVLYNSSQGINYMDAIFGEGWKAYTLNAYNDGTLTFKKQNSEVQYGTPYIVYVASAPSHPNGVLLQGAYTQGNSPRNTTKGTATFQGTYVRKDFAVNDNWYGVISDGRVMKAGTGAYVKGYRAYFTGVSAPSTPGARIAIVIEGEGDTTDLGFVKMVDEESKDKDVYTLSGMKVTKAGKGIYIVNGRKIVIK